jgi:hypothetical protein
MLDEKMLYRSDPQFPSKHTEKCGLGLVDLQIRAPCFAEDTTIEMELIVASQDLARGYEAAQPLGFTRGRVAKCVRRHDVTRRVYQSAEDRKGRGLPPRYDLLDEPETAQDPFEHAAERGPRQMLLGADVLGRQTAELFRSERRQKFS